MKPYSLDLRERIVKAVKEEGMSVKQAAERFGVSRWSANRYLNRAEAGTLEADKPPGLEKKLDEKARKKLKAQVKKHKDWTREQHANALEKSTGIGLTSVSIGNYLKFLGITRKKDFLSSRT